MVQRPSVVRPSVVRRRSQFQTNIFSSETALPIKAKFYVEPHWVGGTKVCSRHAGHMTKMAATPIYGKNPSKTFSGTGGPISTKLIMQHRGLQPIIVCSNDDPGGTLTYFTARSNLVSWASLSEKVKTMDFSTTIKACDMKVGRCRQLIEFMTVCEN